MFKNLPNFLTMTRILVIPFVILAMLFENSGFGHRLAAGLFLYACITDFFDGYLARVFSVQSRFGTFLDPIADKLLVASVIVVLVHYERADLFPAIAIICREILVSGLREFLSGIRVSVPVSKLAKLKTFLQMSAIFILILGNRGSGLDFVSDFGNSLLWIAAILTLVTGYVYLHVTYKHFRKHG